VRKLGSQLIVVCREALFDWLASVAPVTLEQMGLKPLKLRTQRSADQRLGLRRMR
jgi:hypothetical protein